MPAPARNATVLHPKRIQHHPRAKQHGDHPRPHHPLRARPPPHRIRQLQRRRQRVLRQVQRQRRQRRAGYERRCEPPQRPVGERDDERERGGGQAGGARERVRCWVRGCVCEEGERGAGGAEEH